MSSGWVPGCPVDPIDGYGGLVPIAATAHRTYGSWAGDYSVIKANGLAQLLIGKEDGHWVQFMPLYRVAYHCNGANFKAFGVEIEGVNEDDPLTPWQEARLGDVIAYAESIGIPRTYLDPYSVPPASVWVNGGGFTGWISHDSVRTDDGSSQHTDLISVDAWNLANGGGPAPSPAPTLNLEDLMEFTKNPHAKTEVWCLAGNTRRHVSEAEWNRAQTVYYPGGPYHLLDLPAEEFDTYRDVSA